MNRLLVPVAALLSRCPATPRRSASRPSSPRGRACADPHPRPPRWCPGRRSSSTCASSRSPAGLATAAAEGALARGLPALLGRRGRCARGPRSDDTPSRRSDRTTRTPTRSRTTSSIWRPRPRRVILELPLAPLCRVDCAGLCAVCGVDRNVTSCRCQPDQIRGGLHSTRSAGLTRPSGAYPASSTHEESMAVPSERPRRRRRGAAARLELAPRRAAPQHVPAVRNGQSSPMSSAPTAAGTRAAQAVEVD